MVGRGAGECSLLHEVARTTASGAAVAALQPTDGGGVRRVGAAIRAFLWYAPSFHVGGGGGAGVPDLAGNAARGCGSDTKPGSERVGLSVRGGVAPAARRARRRRPSAGAGAPAGRI